MRKRACVALVGLLLTSTGCQITLPSGLGPLGVTGGPPKPGGDPAPSDLSCADRFTKLDKNKDKFLSLDEYVAKGGEKDNRMAKAEDARKFLALDADGDRKLSVAEYQAGCNEMIAPAPPPTPMPTAPATRPPGSDCGDAFTKYDADEDGNWDLEEFRSWDATRPRPKMRCTEGVGLPVAMGSGNIVAAGGGNLVARRVLTQVQGNAGAGLISDNGSVFVSNNGGVLVADNGGGLISNNGGGLVANNGGLISNNAGGLISNNAGMIIAPPPFPCPPDDPEFRFRQFDHDDDGVVSAKEFCAGPVARPMPIASGGPEPYPYPIPYPSEGPYPMPSYTPGPMGCEEGFFQADADGDGLVSPEEYRGIYRAPDVVYTNGADGQGAWVEARPMDPDMLFKQQDQDADGYLSLEESCGFPGPVATPPPGDWCNFWELDANGDGEGSWEEFVQLTVRNEFPAPTKDVAYTRFAQHDFDQNFIITKDEWCGYTQPEPYPYEPSPVPSWNTAPTPTPMPWPTKKPTTGDLPPCYGAFVTADDDGDRKVTVEAWAAARLGQIRWIQAPSDEDLAKQKASFAAEAKGYDRNGDGVLTADEVQYLCGAEGETNDDWAVR
jgi:Ca2+-binding EF-hand superfamily protein